jgi:hypothetical protein
MARLKRLSVACVFALTLAGGVFLATPADAATLPESVCAQLANSVSALERLAAQYPNNRVIAFLLERAQALYASHC